MKNLFRALLLILFSATCANAQVVGSQFFHGIRDGVDSTRKLTITAASAAKVDGSAVTQPISAASLPLPAGASTAAKQPALGTAGTASADVITVQGIASMTPILVNGSGVTQPISGSVTVSGSVTANAGTNLNTSLLAVEGGGNLAASAASLSVLDDWDETDRAKVNLIAGQVGVAGGSGVVSALTQRVVLATDVALPAGTNVIGALSANQSSNVAQINGVTPLMGNGVTGTGSQRVTISSDNTPFPVKVDQTTPGTTNAVSLAQIGATTVATGNGVVSGGVQRVSIASDNTAFSVNAVQSGTWTVQPGNTANTTPWLVTQTPSTTGGLSKFHLVTGASTNATNLKASAGQLFCWFIYNSNAAARKVAFHNTAGTPTAGAGVTDTRVIPPASAANACSTNGIAFSTGIAITTVTGLADSDATGVAANDLVIDLYYK